MTTLDGMVSVDHDFKWDYEGYKRIQRAGKNFHQHEYMYMANGKLFLAT